MDYSEEIRNYLELEKQTLDTLNTSEINSVLNEIIKAYQQQGTIYIFGNGGSASTASHIANDFNKGISEYTENKFRFVCLNDNIPTVLAIANDISYDEIFRFQLRGKLQPNDLVIGISGSGNSKNVIHAVRYAQECGIRTIGITGFDGGVLRSLADLSLHVPVNNMQITEDVHLIFNHLMMSVLYKAWKIKAH